MLILEEIRKTFGASVALDGLSLEARQGEIFGLLGPNGAGKTTAVSIACGLLEPDSGRVSIGSFGAPRDPRCRARIGLAPQTIALYDELTGRENLAFFGRLQNISGRRLEESVARALDLAGLKDRASDRVKTYSGGMKRRLNMAAALIHDPPLLLLDEPTAGVDPQSRNALFENVAALRGEGKTIIYTTHYIEEAQKLCDRVAVIDHGRLLALDTVDGLIEAHGGASVLVADLGGGERRIETEDPLAALIGLKEKENLKSFRLERPDLERVFLNLTGRKLRD